MLKTGFVFVIDSCSVTSLRVSSFSSRCSSISIAQNGVDAWPCLTSVIPSGLTDLLNLPNSCAGPLHKLSPCLGSTSVLFRERHLQLCTWLLVAQSRFSWHANKTMCTRITIWYFNYLIIHAYMSIISVPPPPTRMFSWEHETCFVHCGIL